MTACVSDSFPLLLHKAWALTDLASRQDRNCDPLDQSTLHEKFETIRSAYWICSVTGHMSREDSPDNLEALYDDSWKPKITTRPERPKRVRDNQKWLEWMAPYRHSGRLFEVGTDKGAFLKTAADAGWTAQ